ncbi:bifunctional adenosylcobinamide kinase/adenosylcobinamide-phosphate guanylyltransferase [Bauldia sp.]|uniref:bifunctional adenosylcobinamide kinase/adenosylcobinamide-phosphate guanylyltransferase n=1 Tax=Bauldia sp. TaxID=2575872 RepID=UPI003BA90380
MSAAHLLVVGGRRSGKSRYAEEQALLSGLAPVYLATAEAGDAEMAARIAVHRQRRGDDWMTVEAPLEMPTVLSAAATSDRIVLVDCLTLWLANIMEAERDVESESEALVSALDAAAGPVILVSNEVGSGIVPVNALARRYADAQGILNQKVAATVDRVVTMIAGIPLQLKPNQQANS